MAESDLKAAEKPQDKIRNGLPQHIDVGALDAQYIPISPFKDWANLEVDHAIWRRQLEFLERRGAQFAPEDLDRALNVGIRAAAVESGAIEGLYETDRGLTYTIAVQEATWQSVMRSHDERMPAFFEAQLAAYDLASEIAESREPVTEVWIRQLHEVLSGPQAEYDVLTPQGWMKAPLPKGEYKSQPNHVTQGDRGTHAYAPVDLTPSEMHRFVLEVNSDAFRTAHPVLQAAYAHYGLVGIHPFADGNGRVARAFASLYLRRESHIPLLIWLDQRSDYFNGLEAADEGNPQTLVEFVFDRAVEAFAFVANQLGPPAEDYVAALSKLYVSYGGLTFEQLDETALRIMQHVQSLASEATGELNLPREVSARIDGNTTKGFTVEDPAYRSPLRTALNVRVRLSAQAPAGANIEFAYRLLVAREAGARYAFRIECTEPTGGSVDVRLSDVNPGISDAFTRQSFPWIRRTIAEGLGRLTARAEEARRNQGYS